MDTSLKISIPFVLSVLICSIMVLAANLWSHANTQYISASTAFFGHQQLQVNDQILHQSFPVIEAKNQRIKQGQEFDCKRNVRAYDQQDGDLSAKLEVYGYVDVHKKGLYVLRYVVRNSIGLKCVRHIQVLVD